ncbi:hypothetical protein F4805DRAFT_378366 [Annulohypoxylon moriforme]|nr:hypothetical protein F4805DRAFT_378366 [Annulohypoxylon moriforme]
MRAVIVLIHIFQCLDCIANTQKLCRGCGGGYCIIHYEGSTLTFVCLRPQPSPLFLSGWANMKTSVIGAQDAVADDLEKCIDISDQLGSTKSIIIPPCEGL